MSDLKELFPEEEFDMHDLINMIWNTDMYELMSMSTDYTDFLHLVIERVIRFRGDENE